MSRKIEATKGARSDMMRREAVEMGVWGTNCEKSFCRMNAKKWVNDTGNVFDVCEPIYF
jgi:hypothetical protein